jgi:5'-nucleotidase
MVTRRSFLKTALLSSLGLPLRAVSHTLTGRLLDVPLGNLRPGETHITILHTNDTHSQIEPLPQGGPYGGDGGVARRATLIEKIRAENPYTLLVDAGDAFQGTPYFNLYRGEVEFKTMSAMGYDAMTLGNHEFDNGVDALAAAMKFANFDFVSANYDVRGTSLETRVKPYVVRTLNGVRIGIFGLGINLVGLNSPLTFKGIRFLDPVETARRVARDLREREQCAMVVCLSHLGYYPQPQNGELGDSQLAAQVNGIDFIASGHTHTFMSQPVIIKQPSGKETVIFQVGQSGVYLGRVDFRVRGGQVKYVAGQLLSAPSHLST